MELVWESITLISVGPLAVPFSINFYYSELFTKNLTFSLTSFDY
jgi:hypothetical protein